MDQKTRNIVIAVSAACLLIAAALFIFLMRVPVYTVVTDGGICGYDTETITDASTQFLECPNPNKVKSYAKSQKVDITSPPSGLSNQQEQTCANMKKDFEQKIGAKAKWSNQQSSATPIDMPFVSTQVYIYKCSAKAEWEPIYVVERWEGCDRAPAITTSYDVPKTCMDKSKEIGTKWRWQ